MLSLPYVFALNGYLVASFYLLVGALATIWSNRILGYYALMTGKVDYSDLCFVALGKWGSKTLTYCVQGYMFITFVSYQIMMTSLFKYVMMEFGVDKKFVQTTFFSACFAIPLAAFVLFPLSCMNNVAAFRHVSMLSLGSLTYIMLVFVIEAPYYYKHFSKVAYAHPYYIDWNLFPGFAMICFSYGCQAQMLPIQKELKEPTLPRVNSMITRAGLVIFVFFSAIAVSGFLSQLSEIAPVSVERKTPTGEVSYSTVLAAICVELCIIAAFPVNALPFKRAFFHQILKKEEYSQKENFLFAGSVLVMTTAISLAFPSITSAIGLAGGLLGINLYYLLPLLIQLKLSNKPWYSGHNLVTLIFFGTLCIFGYLSVGVTFVKTYKGLDKMPRWIPTY